ncbi:MAG: magnesium transporter [Ruminococcaceae bacterium]|nr:magnesium transporter [Oscillospiraceae bacterium]
MDFEILTRLLEEHKFVEFINELDSANPIDAAEYLSYVKPEYLPKVFRLLKKDTAAEIFPELDTELQEAIISHITDTEITNLVDELFIDDTVDLLEELPAGVVNRILRATDPERRNEINKFLSYPPHSAGSVMTSEFLSVYSHMTVSEAIEKIRKTGDELETVYVIYVTDERRILQGYLELKHLLFSSPERLIRDIMDDAIISATTLDDREDAAALISKYDLLALPIVDKEKRLVGILTIDDAIDVIEEETTADIEIMAAISPTEKPYLKTGVFSTFRKRIPWLLLLLISATFTGSIISHYEAALGEMVILTAFIPMLMDSAGNAGGQSSVTVIRGLSLGEIKLRNIFSVLWKEFRVSLLCGIVLSGTVFAKAMLIDRASVYVALVVSLTLLSTVIMAKLIGCTMPILAKRLGFDPAVMASPFITTIVDALSLLVYFAIASRILGI